MTMQFTDPSLSSGAEPTELLKPLAYEYLVELNRMGFCQFAVGVGTDGLPVLIAIIPHVTLEDGKIVEIVGKEMSVGKPEGEPDAISVSD